MAKKKKKTPISISVEWQQNEARHQEWLARQEQFGRAIPPASVHGGGVKAEKRRTRKRQNEANSKFKGKSRKDFESDI
jgi:hypothetical protein